jgi:hypothetical protein
VRSTISFILVEREFERGEERGEERGGVIERTEERGGGVFNNCAILDKAATCLVGVEGEGNGEGEGEAGADEEVEEEDKEERMEGGIGVVGDSTGAEFEFE